MPNGPNPYPNRMLTEYYLICRNNQTIGTETCVPGEVFDPIKAVCTKEVDKCKYGGRPKRSGTTSGTVTDIQVHVNAQSNFTGSNIFGTMEICSRHG